MAGEYDDKFKEITGMLQKMQKSVGGIDELRMEVRDIRNEVRDTRNEVRDIRNELRDNTTKLTENTRNLTSLTTEVKILSGQFKDVGVMAIEDHKRIDNLEERVGLIEA